MRYGLLVLVICLGLVFDVGLYIASSDDSFGSFDPLHPSTLLPVIANRFRDLHAQAGETLRALVDEFAAPFRQRMQRDLPVESLPK